jgi:alkaline phosphatase D
VDFVFHYGDYIYEHRLIRPADDNSAAARRFPAPTGEAVSLDSYRHRYAGYKMDADLQSVHASAPFLMSFDDHEVDNNWAGDIDQNGTPSELFLLRRAAAFQAYYEHMPLRASALPRAGAMSLYRRFHFGSLAQVDVLDTRQYRSDQPCNDGIRRDCEAALDPGRTMLGKAQEDWLHSGLSRSRAQWNLLAQQVVMMQQDRDPDPNGVTTSMDKWDGAVAARDRLFATLKRRRVANPIVFSGDIHNNWAGELKADFADPRSPTIGHEFVVTSISSDGDGRDLRPETPAILEQNPHIRFFNDQRGYLSVDLTPTELKARFEVVDFVSRPGAPKSTRASFVVEAGRPELNRL